METKFFIGSSPSMASRIINPESPAAGVMISCNALRKRVSDFNVDDWILDSGAFTEISKYGAYRYSVDEYWGQIQRWNNCGNLLIAISQDWMCEEFILRRTGLSIEEHQSLTIERYDSLKYLAGVFPIMAVLQGYQSSDYLNHLLAYGDRLGNNAWVGVGSVCKRNSNPSAVKDILKVIKAVRPDLRLHGFGLKILALENPEIRNLLYSCDSMAWSYAARFNDSVHNLSQLSEAALKYQEKVHEKLEGVKRSPPHTAGAGNGQGRKPKWKSPTTAIRVPQIYADRLIQLARQWETE